MSTSRARLCVLVAAVLFGTTGTAQALGPDGAPPVVVGAGRLLVGSVGLLLASVLLARRAGIGPQALPGHHTAGRAAGRVARPAGAFGPRQAATSRAVWTAGVGVAAYQLSFFAAVQATGVAVGTVVALGSAPVLTGVLAWLAGRGAPGRRWGVATALAAAGLAVLTLAAGPGRASPAGIALALCAGASFAVYTLGVKHLLDTGAPADRAVAAVFTAGAALLCPAFLLLPVAWAATWQGAAMLLWLGLVPTTAAYLLFARGLRHLAAAEVSTLTLAEPLTAALLGVLALREPLTAGGLAGALLLLGGLAVLAVGNPRRQRPGTRGRPGPARDAVPARAAR